jgi:hypothetical protein
MNFIYDGMYFLYGGFTDNEDNKEKLYFTSIDEKLNGVWNCIPFEEMVVDFDPSFFFSYGNILHANCFIEDSTIYLFGFEDELF